MSLNEGLKVVRSQREELKQKFIRTYLNWRELADTPGVWGSIVDRAWDEYCEARDEWICPVRWGR